LSSPGGFGCTAQVPSLANLVRHVSIAVTTLGEGAATVVALIRLRVQMDADVINGVAQFLKGARAVRAHELLVQSSSPLFLGEIPGQR